MSIELICFSSAQARWPPQAVPNPKFYFLKRSITLVSQNVKDHFLLFEQIMNYDITTLSLENWCSASELNLHNYPIYFFVE